MHRALLTFGPLFLGLALLALGIGLLGTLLGIRMADADASPLAAGIIMTGYFAGQLAGSMIIQRWIEAVGHIRTYAAFTAVLSAATLVHPFEFETTLWTVLRLLQGFCMAGLLLCVESWLNSRATRETRGQLLALYMVVFYGAYAVSQFLLNLPDSTGFGLFIISSMLLSLAAVPVALARMEAPEMPKPSPLGLRRLYEASPTGIVGAFLSGIILGAFYGMAAFYARAIGLSVGDTAGFMTSVIFGGLIMQLPIGRLSDRLDRRMVIVGVSAALAVAAASIALVGNGPYGLLLTLGVLFGGFSFTLYPLCVANANDHVEATDAVATSRGLLVAYSAGSVLGPAGGAAMLLVLPQGVFLFMAAIAVALVLFVLGRMRVAAPPPADLQAPFQVLPRTTPEVMELDPRGAETDAGR